MADWSYGGYAAKYGVVKGGEYDIGTGRVKCCDLTEELPEFMKRAQVIFVDPPCSQGNLQSFYTKAGEGRPWPFDQFLCKLFSHIMEIAPLACFVEAFASNLEDVKALMSSAGFRHVTAIHSHYYHNRKNQCWIVAGVNKEPEGWEDWCMSVHDMDEQSIIREICNTVSTKSVIGDLCMGRGLVGYYANKCGRPFVGTELNPNRLAVLFHRIETGKL